MKKNVTKRLFTLLLSAMLVFPLISCGGKTPEANEPTPDTPAVSTPPETPVTVSPPAETPVTVVPPSETPDVPETPDPPQPPVVKKIAVERRIYDTAKGHDLGSKREFVFNSRQELEEFYEANPHKFGEDFLDFIAKYDDAYFADRSLICACVNYSSERLLDKGNDFIMKDSKYILTLSRHVLEDLTLYYYNSDYAFFEPEAGYKFTESDFVLYWSP